MAALASAEALVAGELGGRIQARRGELIDALEGDGLLALLEGTVVVGRTAGVGVITWLRDEAGRTAEIRVLAVAGAHRGHGIGRRLLAAAEDALRAAGVTAAWLVTTNDNLAALALYQKAGWRLSALRLRAVDELRRSVKPSIPAVGAHGIAIRDELELSKEL